MQSRRIAIVGSAGVPARYGGFETLVENLVRYHDKESLAHPLMVYCSGKAHGEPSTFLSARCKRVPLKANGIQSIFYDGVSLLHAVLDRSDAILLLGVSGAIALPIVRLVSSSRIVTNIDGMEWKREKWGWLASCFLRLSEHLAVTFSDEVIADNEVVADYLREKYGVFGRLIAYGGDHAVAAESISVDGLSLPEEYACSLCRIEPENNVQVILDAFARQSRIALVMVGNWGNSKYGRTLRLRYSGYSHLSLVDPIYDLGKLRTLRSQALIYVHGHSAGGTNPSLVEAMHFGLPIIAYDCAYNRSSTANRALYFRDSEELLGLLESSEETTFEFVGHDMIEIARQQYTWHVVGAQYFSLLSGSCQGQPRR